MFTIEEAENGACREMFLNGYDEEREEDDDERYAD